MSLDNQRNLKLAIHRDRGVPGGGRAGRARDERLGARLLRRGRSADDRRLAGAARLHHQDLPRARPAPRRPAHPPRDGRGFSASIVDAALYIVNNHARLRAAGSSLVLYLPKIQTAEEAALWHDILATLEAHLGLPLGAIKTYVLVEQLEACFQLMEIRAALGAALRRLQHRPLGLHQQRVGRDGLGRSFVNPNIDAITMTYGYMRNYEDRVRRAVQHRRPPRTLCALAGRHGTEHSRRIGGGRRERHGARGRRRRARTARGRQRQVGRPLEDGAHRPSGLGKDRDATTSSVARSRRSRTRRPTPTA